MSMSITRQRQASPNFGKIEWEGDNRMTITLDDPSQEKINYAYKGTVFIDPINKQGTLERYYRGRDQPQSITCPIKSDVDKFSIKNFFYSMLLVSNNFSDWDGFRANWWIRSKVNAVKL